MSKGAKIIIGGSLIGIIFGAVLWRGLARPPQAPGAIGPAATAANQAWQKSIGDIYERDKDFDGLTDSEEEKLGTDPAAADTDRDGLLDGDEVKQFKTNPKKADSDGDGVSDTVAVRRKQLRATQTGP